MVVLLEEGRGVCEREGASSRLTCARDASELPKCS